MSDEEPFGHLPEGGEPEPESGDATRDGSPSRIPHRYRRSVGASVLAAGMLGLRDVLEEPKDDEPVVAQFLGEGDTDRPIEVDLHPDDPSASVVRLRDVGDH